MALEETTAGPAGPGYVNNKDAQLNRLRRIEGDRKSVV